MREQSVLEKVIDGSRDWCDVPAIGAVYFRRGEGSEAVVSGQRAQFAEDRVEPQDMWHIGSCTKTMTATILARLVERGVTGFDATLGESLPGVASGMHPAFARTTLREVLTHSAGVMRDAQSSTFSALRRSRGSVEAQRRVLAAEALQGRPRSDAGYSNMGYIVLGAVIEHLTGMSWESALEAEVMRPLGLSRYGFGPPGKAGFLSHPRGHYRIGEVWQAQTVTRWNDNPRAYGPAGRVHIALDDWMRFLQVHVNAGPPSYLKPSTLSALHRPAENGYAMGWGATRDTQTGEPRLHHAGSNNAWYAQAMLLPQRGAAVGIVCNAFDEGVAHSISKLTGQALASARMEIDTAP